MKVIGIAGTNGSGKDTVAQMLVERYGYYFVSASDMLGDELKRRGLPTEREHKRQVSAEWRKQYGLGAIVDKAAEEAKAINKDKVVVASLRNPGEVDRVHELGGQVVWVDADTEVRYRRITSNDRGRIEDKKTYEEFLAEEQAEMQSSGDETTLNMSAVKAKADIFIDNNDNDIDSFKGKAEKQLIDVGIL